MSDIYESYEQYGSRIDESLRKMAAIQSLVMGKKLSEEETCTIKEFKCIQDFLDAPDNSKQESDLKKLFAEAVILGMEQGTLPFAMPADASAESIAAAIDEGLTRIKTAYQLENGMIEDVYQAQEVIVEHQAVRIVTFEEMAIEAAIDFADKTIDKVEANLHAKADFVLEHSDAILTSIEAAFPQAAPAIEMARQIVTRTKPQIQRFIHNGISNICTSAKQMAREAIHEIPKLLKRSKNWLLE